MINLETLPPGASDLFSAFDHVVRAAQPDAPEREWHLKWAEYHCKRFRNYVHSHRQTNGLPLASEDETAMWKKIEDMLKNIAD